MPDVRTPTAEELEDRVAALERRRHGDEGLFVEKGGPALLKEARDMMDLVRGRRDDWLRVVTWDFLNAIELWLDGRREWPPPWKYQCRYHVGKVLKIIDAYRENTSLSASARLDYDCHVEPDKRICKELLEEWWPGLSDEEWEGRLRLIRVLETRWKRCQTLMDQPPLRIVGLYFSQETAQIIERYVQEWRPEYYGRGHRGALKRHGYERWKRIRARLWEFDRHMRRDMELCRQMMKDCEGEPPDEAVREQLETLRPIGKRWRRCADFFRPHICGAQPSEP